MTNRSRIAFLIATYLFLAGITTQVFLAGMVVVAGRMGWANHASLGHALALPLLVMLVTVHLGRMPGSMKQVAWLLFLVYIIQADVIIFLRGTAPVIAAFHPVLALADFALALTLAKQGRQLGKQVDASASPRSSWAASAAD